MLVLQNNLTIWHQQMKFSQNERLFTSKGTRIWGEIAQLLADLLIVGRAIVTLF